MDWEEVSITDLEARVSPEILARGQEYQQTGHILRACRCEGIIAGEVAGTGGSYRVRLTLDNGKIDGDCTCPYPGFCKHMVALTIAWIEKRINFYQLDSRLGEKINNPEQLIDFFIKLVRKDPLNFLDLISPATPEESFVNSRGVLNLIRNTFQGPPMTHEQIEVHWERVKRIEELVAKAIAEQEKDAPELLRELLKGVADSFREYSTILLKNTFIDLLLLAHNLPKGWTREEIIPFNETLLGIYLDKGLWELADSVRPVLVDLHSNFPSWLLDKLEKVEWDSLGSSEIIPYYELLALVFKKGIAGAEYFQEIIVVLNRTAEGQLWLIDRIMDDDPDQAYLLAKEGLRNNCVANKRSFRDRLIEIHLRRSENKQAASLSFIQFQEEPNLQEYLRLKAILTGRSGELQNYLDKLDRVIEGQGLEILAARIAYDQENWSKLKVIIGEFDPAEVVLKELARLIMAENNRFIPIEIFEAMITRLLTGVRSNWETVLGLLVCYKKLCLKNSWKTEWSKFRVHLNTEYGEDQRFARKFGAVLAG